MSRVHGFPPITAPDARVLVLGTMPGIPSLRAGQYYAHPRNAFWRIAGDLFGFAATAPYHERVAALQVNRIALWDVLQLCTRDSSLDSDIDDSTAVPNDFAGFLGMHGGLKRICLNGTKACHLFERHVAPVLPPAQQGIERVVLPSTSPAHASMPYLEKLRLWRKAIG